MEGGKERERERGERERGEGERGEGGRGEEEEGEGGRGLRSHKDCMPVGGQHSRLRSMLLSSSRLLKFLNNCLLYPLRSAAHKLPFQPFCACSVWED